MIKVPEGLSPGDTILDPLGDPIIQHFAPGMSALCFGREAFRQARDGQISVDTYAAISALRVEVELAYNRGEPLPEGVTIEPGNPEMMEWLAAHTVK